MNKEELQSVLKKIKKCLALSKSANEHEAAAALRQAQKLMAMYGLSQADTTLSEVTEAKTKARGSKRPAQWESHLAAICANAFGCKLFHSQIIRIGTKPAGYWRYIGLGAAPELSAYAFTVLSRQIRRERALLIAQMPHYATNAEKTKRGDIYCTHFVASVWRAVEAFAQPEGTEDALNAYLNKFLTPNRTELKPTVRGAHADQWSQADYEAALAGQEAGKHARLHRPVDAASAPAMLVGETTQTR